MKIKVLSASAIAALMLLGSCSGGSSTGKSIEEAKPATQIDSLSYYVGLASANNFWQMAQQDTVLKTEQGKADFVKGFNEGMKLIDGVSESYRQGLLAGMQIAMSAEKFKTEYNQEINIRMMADGFIYGTRADSLAQNPKATQYVQNTIQQIEKKKADDDAKAAQSKLQSLASKGFKKINNDLYEKVVTPGTGDVLKEGQLVSLSFKYTDADGKELNIPVQNDQTIEFSSKNMQKDHPIFMALSTMKMNETAQFAAPAVRMFNGMQKNFGIDSDAVVIVTITVKPGTPKAEQGAKPAAQAAPAPQGK